jgi:hypothetical protein
MRIFMAQRGSCRRLVTRAGMAARGLLCQILLTALCGPALAGGIVAASADEFLSSLGIVPHVDQGPSGASYIQPLRYLGVRNIHDGVRNPSQIELIHRETGVRLDLFCQGSLNVCIATAKRLSKSGALMAVEGPNEPNNFPIIYDGQPGGGMGSWLPVARLQEALYRAVKSDPDLRNYPVFAVSESGAEVDNVGLQFLTVPPGANTTLPKATRFADFANAHNYVSSTRNLYLDNQAWNAADPVLNGPWDGLFGNYGITWRHHFQGYTSDRLLALPRVTTETGWDSVSGIGGERVQGVVLVNAYLAQFKRGWRHTFIYQLRDGEGGIGNQGVFNADSTPKLAATYIHNLTTILADAKGLPSSGSLDYSIDNQPRTVHDLLLQKSDGWFALVVWDENVRFHDKVTVRLGGRHARVNLYDVTTGSNPKQTLTDVTAVCLDLSDHAVIIEVAD